jgi:hypothetical protein
VRLCIVGWPAQWVPPWNMTRMGRGLAAFDVWLAIVGSRMRTRDKVAVVHGSSLDRSSDVFGTSYNRPSLRRSGRPEAEMALQSAIVHKELGGSGLVLSTCPIYLTRTHPNCHSVLQTTPADLLMTKCLPLPTLEHIRQAKDLFLSKLEEPCPTRTTRAKMCRTNCQARYLMNN